MKYLTSQQIRETWLNFFKDKGHMVEKGASLIPQNDPTLLWINAGVSALKKYFDGSEVPEKNRIVNVQKCIRTNDISNVGKTARHHTFFEMLGNFSIGDYFRNEVIPWAFELLTSEKYFGLDKDKLYITHHPSDTDTKNLWIKQGMKEDHLIPLEDNFWQIGEGPCGPDTEIFYDRGEKFDPNNLGLRLLKEDIENDRYIEIWNIVFSQFNAENGVDRKDYKELPHKNIDTGAGLERFASVMQNTETNFETDLFMPIIKETEKLSKVPYKDKNLMAYRVIADHIRTCTFALSDGANFSNEGRGYVLRRVLRRAMRYGQKINLNEPFLYKLVDSVVEVMKDFYPYLIDKKAEVKEKIKTEEERFIKTLNAGEAIVNELLAKNHALSGKDAFLLYDSYGFPIELTMEMCEDKGISVDLEEFKVLLSKQREQARSARKTIESFNKQSKDLLEFKDKSTFVYDNNDIKARVIALFKDGEKVEKLTEEGEVVFDITNFYAEMGGEIADTGKIYNENVDAIVLDTTFAPNKQHLMHVKLNKGDIKVGDEFTLSLDKIKHHNIMKNHSATHLLQSALIKVLGDDVKQKGSFVCEDYLRFDFNFNRKVSQEELIEIEKTVNEFIDNSISRVTLELPIDEALKLGAIAEFGEKYGKTVRVVTFGEVSKELCGGCHVDNTSEIGCFVIESEESISSGVRRIVALTGLKAYNYLKTRNLILDKVKNLVAASIVGDIEKKINSMNDLNKELLKKIHDFEAKTLQNLAKNLKNEIKEVGENRIIIKRFENTTRQNLMQILDDVKANETNLIAILIGVDEGKKALLVSCAKEQVTKGIRAGDLVKKITSKFGGNGGGKPETAQGSIVNDEELLKADLSWIING